MTTTPTLRFRNDGPMRKRLFVPDAFAHPAKGHIALWQEMVERYSQPGDTLLDPMSGIGTSLVAALMGRNVVCVELEAHFVDPMRRSWEKMRTMPMLGYTMGTATIIQGDARHLGDVLADCVVTSPPFGGLESHTGGDTPTVHGIGRNTRQQRPSEAAGMVTLIAGDGYTRRPVDAIVTKEYNSHYGKGTATGGQSQTVCPVHGIVEASQGRDRTALSSNAADGSGKAIQHKPADSPESNGAVGYPDSWEGQDRASERPIQEWEAKSPLSKDDGQDSLRTLRQHGLPSYPPSEQQPLRQSGGESGGSMQSLPPEPAQESVVGSKESRPATSAIQCTCRLGQVAAIITSPPFHDTGNKSESGGEVEHFRETGEWRTGLKYSDAIDNIGNLRSAAYWDAMRQVYAECYRVLRPGGILALVLKGFTRDGKYVDLPGQTEALLLDTGWRKHDHWRRELWSLSFWRILQKRRDPAAWDDRLMYEEVLAVRKGGIVEHGGYTRPSAIITSPPYEGSEVAQSSDGEANRRFRAGEYQGDALKGMGLSKGYTK